MATAETKLEAWPAYVAYGTFKNFISAMKTGGVPNRIDKTVMPGLSGGVQSHLATALTFLGLVDDRDEPTKAIHGLVKAADTDQWPAALKEVVADAYEPIIGNLDLAKTTAGQLTDAFRTNTRVTGATLDKSLRFYLQAVKDAQIELGKYLADMKVKTSYSKNPRQKPASAGAAVVDKSSTPPKDEDHTQKPAKGMIEFPIHFRGKLAGNITVPDDIGPDDCPMIERVFATIKTYAGVQ